MGTPLAPKAARAWALEVRRKRSPDAAGLFLLEGPKAVRDALHAGASLRHAFLVETPSEELLDLAAHLRTQGVDVTLCATAYLERLATTATAQGIVAIAVRPAADPAELLRVPAFRVVYLDGVQDPGNAGAILRSARALGATHLVWGPGTADPFMPKAARAAAGAALRMPVLRDADDRRLLTGLAATGCDVIATDAAAATPLERLPPSSRWVLLLGSEGAGLSEEVLGLATTTVRVPMVAGTESLNVAQTAAIVLYVLSARGTALTGPPPSPPPADRRLPRARRP